MKKKTYKLSFFLFALVCICVFAITYPQMPISAKSNLKRNVVVKYTKTYDGILVTYKNKNSKAVKLTGSMNFKDAKGRSLKKEKIKNACLAARSTMAYFFQAPITETGQPVAYEAYKGSITVSKSKKKSYVKHIQIATDLTPVQCNVTAKNLSSKELTSIHATFVFYSKAGTILTCRNLFINCTKPNTALDLVVNYAGMLAPGKVKIYKNWAY